MLRALLLADGHCKRSSQRMTFALHRLLLSSPEAFGAYGFPFICFHLLKPGSQLKCVLRRCTRLSSASTAIVSGGCAGLSFLALPKEERPTIVLFSFVRAAEFLARALSAQGSLPQCISNFAYWDVLVMCLSAMQILFSYVACPHVRDRKPSTFHVSCLMPVPRFLILRICASYSIMEQRTPVRCGLSSCGSGGRRGAGRTWRPCRPRRASPTPSTPITSAPANSHTRVCARCLWSRSRRMSSSRDRARMLGALLCLLASLSPALCKAVPPHSCTLRPLSPLRQSHQGRHCVRTRLCAACLVGGS